MALAFGLLVNYLSTCLDAAGEEVEEGDSGAGGVPSVASSVVVRTAAPGGGGLRAEASYFYMTTLANEKDKLWFSLPEGDLYDYIHPVFRRRPAPDAKGDDHFKWRHIRVPIKADVVSDVYVIQNLHSGRILQYCGGDSACLHRGLPEATYDLKNLDTDLLFRITGKDPNNSQQPPYTINARGDGRYTELTEWNSDLGRFLPSDIANQAFPIYIVGRKGEGQVRMWPEQNGWVARADDSALWTFAYAR